MDPSAGRPEKPSRALPPTPAEDANESRAASVPTPSGPRNNSLRARRTTTPGLIITQETPEPPEDPVGSTIRETITDIITSGSPPAVHLNPGSPTVISPSFSRQHSPAGSLRDILDDSSFAITDRYPRRTRTANSRSIAVIDNTAPLEQGFSSRPATSDGIALQRPPLAQTATGGANRLPEPVAAVPMPAMSLGLGMGNHETGARALRSQRSFLGYDWNIPHTPVAHPPDGQPNGHAHPNGHADGQANGHVASIIAPSTTTHGKTVEKRLQRTLEHAWKERNECSRKAKRTAYALNIAIGAQVVLGAFTTGVAASTSGRQTAIATAVLGGLFTLAASYLARMRGSGEPEASLLKCKDLDNFIRNCEAFVLDYGHIVITEHDIDPMNLELERYIRRFRTMFETILGNDMDEVSGQGQVAMQDRATRSFV